MNEKRNLLLFVILIFIFISFISAQTNILNSSGFYSTGNITANQFNGKFNWTTDSYFTFDGNTLRMNTNTLNSTISITNNSLVNYISTNYLLSSIFNAENTSIWNAISIISGGNASWNESYSKTLFSSITKNFTQDTFDWMNSTWDNRGLIASINASITSGRGDFYFFNFSNSWNLNWTAKDYDKWMMNETIATFNLYNNSWDNRELIILTNNSLSNWINEKNYIQSGQSGYVSNLTVGSPTLGNGYIVDVAGNVRVQGNLTIVGTLSNLSIDNLLINGSLIPDQDAIFDLGNTTSRYRFGYFSDDVFINGVSSKSYLYNQTIPANSYTDTLNNSLATWINTNFLLSTIFNNENTSIWNEINLKPSQANINNAVNGNITLVNNTYKNLLNQECAVGYVVNGSYLNGSFKCIESVSVNHTLITFNLYNSTWDNRYLIETTNSSMKDYVLYVNGTMKDYVIYVNSSMKNYVDSILGINHTLITFNLYNNSWDNRGLVISLNSSLTGLINSVNTTANINHTANTFNWMNATWDNRGLIASVNASITTGGNISWNESRGKILFTNQTYVDTLNNSLATWITNTFLKITDMFTKQNILDMVSGNATQINNTFKNLLGGECAVGYVVNGSYMNGSFKCIQVTSSTNYTSDTFNWMNATWDNRRLIETTNSSMASYVIYVNGTIKDYTLYVNSTMKSYVDSIVGTNYTLITFNLYNNSWDNRGLVISLNSSLTGLISSINTTANINQTTLTFNLYNSSWDNRANIINVNNTYKNILDSSCAVGYVMNGTYLNGSIKCIQSNSVMTYINLALTNQTNIYSANQNLSTYNLTTVDCIIFKNGGKWCSI